MLKFNLQLCFCLNETSEFLKKFLKNTERKVTLYNELYYQVIHKKKN